MRKQNNILLGRILCCKNSILTSMKIRSNPSSNFGNSKKDKLTPPESFSNIPVIPREEDIIYPVSFLRNKKKKRRTSES